MRPGRLLGIWVGLGAREADIVSDLMGICSGRWSSESDGSKPGGDPKWREKAIAGEQQAGVCLRPYKYSQWLHPRFATFARGARLTPERVERVLVGKMLTTQEKDVLLEMLYNREGALA